MSFLGGLDLGTPADRNRTALMADLELRRKRWNRGGYFYRGAGDLLLQHGQFYEGRQIPDRYAHLLGEESNCFINAINACYATNGELRYCEGCYWTGDTYAMAHAWCVDPDGGLVELTLPSTPEMVARMVTRDTKLSFLTPEHWAYWGVIVTVELARAHSDTIGLPMLDRSPAETGRAPSHLDLSEPHDFPVLKVPYDPNRKDIP